MPASTSIGEHESIIANKDGDRNGFRFAGLIIGPRVRTATTARSDQTREQTAKRLRRDHSTPLRLHKTRPMRPIVSGLDTNDKRVDALAKPACAPQRHL
jgi:hypothetical protein